MINLHGKHCDHQDGCRKVPSFGLSGCPAIRCATHKEPGMINLYSKRCDHPDGCSKQPSFSLPGGPCNRCATHKEPGMVHFSLQKPTDPSSRPDTLPGPERGLTILTIAVSGTRGGRTASASTYVNGRRCSAGGGRSGAAVESSGPVSPLASNNMPAASSGRVPSAEPDGRPSATACGIGKRSRQDGPPPASEPSGQQAATGKVSSFRKRPRGMVHGAAAPTDADAVGEAMPMASDAAGPSAPVIKEEAVDGQEASYLDLGKLPFNQEELTRCGKPRIRTPGPVCDEASQGWGLSKHVPLPCLSLLAGGCLTMSLCCAVPLPCPSLPPG